MQFTCFLLYLLSGALEYSSRVYYLRPGQPTRSHLSMHHPYLVEFIGTFSMSKKSYTFIKLVLFFLDDFLESHVPAVVTIISINVVKVYSLIVKPSEVGCTVHLA